MVGGADLNSNLEREKSKANLQRHWGMLGQPDKYGVVANLARLGPQYRTHSV